jgi:hypothetical protein
MESRLESHKLIYQDVLFRLFCNLRPYRLFYLVPIPLSSLSDLYFLARAAQYPVLEQTTSKTIEKPHTAKFRQTNGGGKKGK